MRLAETRQLSEACYVTERHSDAGAWACIKWPFDTPQLRACAYHRDRQSFLRVQGDKIITSRVQCTSRSQKAQGRREQQLVATHAPERYGQAGTSNSQEGVQSETGAKCDLPVFLDSCSLRFVLRGGGRRSDGGSLETVLVTSKILPRSSLCVIRLGG